MHYIYRDLSTRRNLINKVCYTLEFETVSAFVGETIVRPGVAEQSKATTINPGLT